MANPEYEANRSDKSAAEHEADKKTLKVAAKGAGAYLGGAEGEKVVSKVADSKIGDKILDAGADLVDKVPALKQVSNKFGNSKLMDLADKGLDLYGDLGSGAPGEGGMPGEGGSGGGTGGGMPGGGGTSSGGGMPGGGGMPNGGGTPSGGGKPSETPNQVKTNNAGGGEPSSSLPSSGDKNVPQPSGEPPMDMGGMGGDAFGGGGGLSAAQSAEPSKEDKKDKEGKDKEDSLFSNFQLSKTAKLIIVLAAPSIIVIMFLLAAAGMVVGIFGDFDDAFGISQTTGEDTGNLAYSAATQEQQDFYDRVNSVKTDYQSKGKTVDALKIVSVYHVMKTHGSNMEYKDMTTSVIEEIADSMFDGNTYSEDTFKSNLINSIFPKYVRKVSKSEREDMADEVFSYISDYYNLIGKTDDNTCSSGSGNCTYDIKGFYIEGKGNVAKNIKVSDLYVRLMQCGTANGHNYGGTFGKALDGEDLVPFEKYVLGCAYQEIGPSSPENAIKAQLVATRSYSLARPTEMGGWRTLSEENGKWILQAASCTQDQVYCDPDKGCSGSDGQWGQIHSGLSYAGAFSREALAEDHPMRTYASDVEGEVLVNAQGYIIYAGFTSTDQNSWISSANNGLNYKQILLQHYNQGSRNYGASDIIKSSCGGSSGGNCSTSSGEYATWKQYRGSWTEVPMGDSGKTIRQIGCLVTSISIQIARSGVKTNIQGEFNPGTFVEYLNNHNGFASGGNFIWASATDAAPDFKYQDAIYTSGWSRDQKLNKIKELTSQSGVYVVAEVKGNTGQHWVAIDHVEGNTVKMFDPGSESTDLWAEYNWANTSELVYYKVG